MTEKHDSEILKDLKMLRLRARRDSQSEVAHKIGISQKTVQRREKKYREIYADLRTLVFEVEKDKRILAFLGEEKLLETPQGNWMRKRWDEGYQIGRAPYGFKKNEKGELIEIPQEIAIVKQIFIGRDRGKSLIELSLETGLPSWKIYEILCNPVYKGWVCFRGKCHPGRHHAVIDPELFDCVQGKKKRGRHRFGLPTLPEGYCYGEDDSVEFDPKKPEMPELMNRILDLRIEGKTFEEIGNMERIKKDKNTIRCWVRNPFFAAKEWDGEKWVDTDHPAVVSFEKWLAANNINVETGPEKMIRKQKDIGQKIENKILEFMAHKELTAPEIAEGVGLTRKTVYLHLRKLRKRGVVKYIPPERRRGAIQLPGKWRIRT